MKVNNLMAVSSTRLRYEDTKPNCPIELFYGENDQYKPGDDWFHLFQLNPKIYKNENHDFYMKEEVAIGICSQIIGNN